MGDGAQLFNPNSLLQKCGRSSIQIQKLFRIFVPNKPLWIGHDRGSCCGRRLNGIKQTTWLLFLSHPSVHPFIHPVTRSSLHPSIHPSIHPFFRSFFRSFFLLQSFTHSHDPLWIHSFIYSTFIVTNFTFIIPSIFLSFPWVVRPSVHPAIYLLIYPPTHPATHSSIFQDLGFVDILEVNGREEGNIKFIDILFYGASDGNA